MLYTCKNGLMISTGGKTGHVLVTLIDDYKITNKTYVDKIELMSELESVITGFPSLKAVGKEFWPLLAQLRLRDTEFFNIISLSKIYEALSENKPYESAKNICLFKGSKDRDNLFLNILPPESSKIESVRFELNDMLSWNYNSKSNIVSYRNGESVSNLVMLYDLAQERMDIFQRKDLFNSVLGFKVDNGWYYMLNIYLKIFKKVSSQA